MRTGRGGFETRPYIAGQRIAMRVGAPGQEGTLTYLDGDHLGSTSLATDDEGEELYGRGYYPFGEERYAVGVAVTDYGFTGQREEAGFGLYDYDARYYDPYLNRFLSPDTIVPDNSNPQSLNRYSYVYNNPLKYTDPDGHIPLLLAIPLIVAGIGFIADTVVQARTNVVEHGMSGWDAMGDVDLAQSANTAAVAGVATATIMVTAPAAVSMVGQGLMATGMATGSTTLFGAGTAAVGASATAYAYMCAPNAGARSAVLNPPTTGPARGGTYTLQDDDDNVQYNGRTNGLSRRRAEWGRHSERGHLRFVEDWRTDDYAVQRGREQMLHDTYNPPLNRIRPISPTNPSRQYYLDMAQQWESENISN